MAYRFNMDLQELRRLMGWIEWRCDVLRDHPQLPLMVQVLRAHVNEYHDRFGENPFQHSMMEDAKVWRRMRRKLGQSWRGCCIWGWMNLTITTALNFASSFFSWFVMSNALSVYAKTTISIPIGPMIWQLFVHPFREWNKCALACMPTDDVAWTEYNSFFFFEELNQPGDSFVFQVSWCKAPNRNWTRFYFKLPERERFYF